MGGHVYSFLDTNLSVVGPNGSISFGGQGGGIDEGGITVAMTGDKATMTHGADGTPMHSLHASRGGTVSLRLQKTSPFNALLDAMYRADTSSAANYGQNTLTLRNAVRGDTIVGTECGFKKLPDNVSAIEGGMMDWAFNAGFIDEVLGDGNPTSAFIQSGING